MEILWNTFSIEKQINFFQILLYLVNLQEHWIYRNVEQWNFAFGPISLVLQ